MLNKDFKEMLQILVEEKVDFLLVGAYAMASYGYIRATGDMDIWVKAEKLNSEKLFLALKKFGAPLQNIKAVDFTDKNLIFQIGVAPLRIDIITSIDGVTYDEAILDKKEIDIEGLKIPILSLKNLIINKSSTGREKDKLDVKILKNILNK